MVGLTDYQKFLLIRPLPKDWPKDSLGIPFIKKDDFSDVNWNKVKFTSMVNYNSVKNKKNSIPLMFHYDYLLERIWLDPLKYFVKFGEALAIPTPDFSAYTNMEPIQIIMNVEKSRWIGATYQNAGKRVIPTITWADSRTYDICFNGIEKGSVVLISTIGVKGFEKEFLEGFNEMKRRIEPSLIIVRGNKIEGMEGKFIFISFYETFNDNCNFKRPDVSNISRIVDIKKKVK